MELLVTARPIDAQRAYQVGLVNQVVPAADLRTAAAGIATCIAGNAPLSVRAGKKLVYSVLGRSREEAWDGAEDLYRQVYLSEDAMEGPLAFRESRPPKWKGR
jgi:enoyl-CoA hydratase/carnithine racemase